MAGLLVGGHETLTAPQNHINPIDPLKVPLEEPYISLKAKFICSLRNGHLLQTEVLCTGTACGRLSVRGGSYSRELRSDPRPYKPLNILNPINPNTLKPLSPKP